MCTVCKFHGWGGCTIVGCCFFVGSQQCDNYCYKVEFSEFTCISTPFLGRQEDIHKIGQVLTYMYMHLYTNAPCCPPSVSAFKLHLEAPSQPITLRPRSPANPSGVAWAIWPQCYSY